MKNKNKNKKKEYLYIRRTSNNNRIIHILHIAHWVYGENLCDSVNDSSNRIYIYLLNGENVIQTQTLISLYMWNRFDFNIREDEDEEEEEVEDERNEKREKIK